MNRKMILFLLWLPFIITSYFSLGFFSSLLFSFVWSFLGIRYGLATYALGSILDPKLTVYIMTISRTFFEMMPIPLAILETSFLFLIGHGGAIIFSICLAYLLKLLFFNKIERLIRF